MAAVAGNGGWLRPFHALPPETAHRLALRLLRWMPRLPLVPSPRLATRLGPYPLPHPLGLAAGFDKSGEAIGGLFRLGFSFVELGTVTPEPQGGNPPPRLFRLPEDEALVNRMGFNNPGMEAVARKLAARRWPGVLGVNLGINRDSRDPVADYARIYRRLAPLADYVTLNVSSPNTPGLRRLQQTERLRPILRRVVSMRSELALESPILVKLDPDLEAAELPAVVEATCSSGADGFVVSNTTVRRPPELRSPARTEEGGLSGRPLFEASTRRLREVARLAGPRSILIGVGGVFSGADAYAKIRAGAQAVQLYTALVYRGPGIIRRILAELETCLAADGFPCLSEAVGADLAA